MSSTSRTPIDSFHCDARKSTQRRPSASLTSGCHTRVANLTSGASRGYESGSLSATRNSPSAYGDARAAAVGDGSYSRGPSTSTVKASQLTSSSSAGGRMNHAPSDASSSRSFATCCGGGGRGRGRGRAEAGV
jgi:hypothetical protein